MLNDKMTNSHTPCCLTTRIEATEVPASQGAHLQQRLAEQQHGGAQRALDAGVGPAARRQRAGQLRHQRDHRHVQRAQPARAAQAQRLAAHHRPASVDTQAQSQESNSLNMHTRCPFSQRLDAC